MDHGKYPLKYGEREGPIIKHTLTEIEKDCCILGDYVPHVLVK